MTDALDLSSFRSRAAQRGRPGYWDFPEVQVKWAFEAGLPDPRSFPIDDLVRISERVLREDAADALHYGEGVRAPALKHAQMQTIGVGGFELSTQKQRTHVAPEGPRSRRHPKLLASHAGEMPSTPSLGEFLEKTQSLGALARLAE